MPVLFWEHQGLLAFCLSVGTRNLLAPHARLPRIREVNVAPILELSVLVSPSAYFDFKVQSNPFNSFAVLSSKN